MDISSPCTFVSQNPKLYITIYKWPYILIYQISTYYPLTRLLYYINSFGVISVKRIWVPECHITFVKSSILLSLFPCRIWSLPFHWTFPFMSNMSYFHIYCILSCFYMQLTWHYCWENWHISLWNETTCIREHCYKDSLSSLHYTIEYH